MDADGAILMKLSDMVCCSWHKPRNAVVGLRCGIIVPKDKLDAIPEGPEKEHMIYSGGMCDPCAKRFLSKKQPSAETIMGGDDQVPKP